MTISSKDFDTRSTSDHSLMLLHTPGTWSDALAWLVRYQRHPLDVILTKGGLTIDGPALYEEVDQREEGAFGIVLTGLCFWITETDVRSVWIDPETDALLMVADPDLSFYLRPR